MTGMSAAVGEGADVGVGLAVHPAHGVAEDADGDRLAVAREHLGDVVQALGHEGLLLALDGRRVDGVRVEVDGVAAELVDAGLEAVPRAQALVVEHHVERGVLEQVVAHAARPLELELEGRVEDRLDLLFGEVGDGDEVTALE